MKKLALLIIVIAILEVSAQTPSVRKSAAVARTMKPKLVVAIVVDQFRYDYLLRFRKDYKEGLLRPLTKGAVFPNAQYEIFGAP